MGAETFITDAKGATAQEAFNGARDDAAYENGHGGYTGTIAEKSEFTVIVPDDMPALFASDEARQQWFADRAERYIDDGDPRIDSKWSPAGCMVVSDGNYIFFGSASC